MKSLELKPTHENLLNTIINDAIGRNKDICMFAEIIDSIDEPCSIALDGNWGSGKTFFVKQTKMLIDSYNPFLKSMSEEDCVNVKKACNQREKIEFQPQVSIYYDAWENDNDSEPILSLIYSIINSINTDFTFSKNTSILNKAAAILEFFTDKNWKDVIDSFKGTSPFKDIKKGKEIEAEIKEFLDSLLPERGNRLVIFVDELDRCKPSFAVKLLERIKHYFDNERLTFVFSINSSELQHSIKKHYGNDFDACRYLDRFFDLRISIPKPDMRFFYNSIGFENTMYTYDIVCDEIINKYNFSLREIAKYIRLTKMAAYKPTHDNNNYDFSFPDGHARSFCLRYIIPLIIGLNVYDHNLYEQFITGKNCLPLCELMLKHKPYTNKYLLAGTETFDINTEGKTYIKFEDRIKEIYNALFDEKSFDDKYEINIGDLSFDRNIKDLIFRTAGLLSKYTTI